MLNICSPTVKRGSVTRELFESIGLAHEANMFHSPDVKRPSFATDSLKGVSSSMKECQKRSSLGSAKVFEPETARRRRESLDKVIFWTVFMFLTLHIAYTVLCFSLWCLFWSWYINILSALWDHIYTIYRGILFGFGVRRAPHVLPCVPAVALCLIRNVKYFGWLYLCKRMKFVAIYFWFVKMMIVEEQCVDWLVNLIPWYFVLCTVVNKAKGTMMLIVLPLIQLCLDVWCLYTSTIWQILIITSLLIVLVFSGGLNTLCRLYAVCIIHRSCLWKTLSQEYFWFFCIHESYLGKLGSKVAYRPKYGEHRRSIGLLRRVH